MWFDIIIFNQTVIINSRSFNVYDLPHWSQCAIILVLINSSLICVLSYLSALATPEIVIWEAQWNKISLGTIILGCYSLILISFLLLIQCVYYHYVPHVWRRHILFRWRWLSGQRICGISSWFISSRPWCLPNVPLWKLGVLKTSRFPIIATIWISSDFTDFLFG